MKIYLIEQKIYPNHQDEWYIYHSDLSRYVSDCAVLGTHTGPWMVLSVYNKEEWINILLDPSNYEKKVNTVMHGQQKNKQNEQPPLALLQRLYQLQLK